MDGETAVMGPDPAPVTVENHRLTYKPLTLDMIANIRNPQSMAYGGKLEGTSAVVVDLTDIQATSTNDPMKALADAVGPPLAN